MLISKSMEQVIRVLLNKKSVKLRELAKDCMVGACPAIYEVEETESNKNNKEKIK